MSNNSGDGGSFSSGIISGTEVHHQQQQQKLVFKHLDGSAMAPTCSSASNNSNGSSKQQQQEQPAAAEKRRRLPGTPDPNAEVIALSPKTLMATNRFVCEICNKGFQRDQNLQLHRRGHNLPWKLKQRTSSEIRKRVYVCPETSCVHHNPARALGDLTGIKKHYSRKHGEKKWKCDKCSKKYAVQSDWKAHSKTCGTKEYKCDCGTIFSRRDSFITHRAFCDALAEENSQALKHGRLGHTLEESGNNILGQAPELTSTPPSPMAAMTTASAASSIQVPDPHHHQFITQLKPPLPHPHELIIPNIIAPKPSNNMAGTIFSSAAAANIFGILPPSSSALPSPAMSATALLQKAAQMGATATSATSNMNSPRINQNSFVTNMAAAAALSDEDGVINGGSFGRQFMHHGFLENNMEVEHDTSRTVSTGTAGLSGLSRFVGHDVDGMTVDFLGIGGRSFHGGVQGQGLMEYEDLDGRRRRRQHGMEGLSHHPFQTQISNDHQEVACDKPTWN